MVLASAQLPLCQSCGDQISKKDGSVAMNLLLFYQKIKITLIKLLLLILQGEHLIIQNMAFLVTQMMIAKIDLENAKLLIPISSSSQNILIEEVLGFPLNMRETYLDNRFQVIDEALIYLQITTDVTLVSLHTLIEEALGTQVTFLTEEFL